MSTQIRTELVNNIKMINNLTKEEHYLTVYHLIEWCNGQNIDSTNILNEIKNISSTYLVKDKFYKDLSWTFTYITEEI